MEKTKKLRELLSEAHALGIMLEKYGLMLHTSEGSEEALALLYFGAGKIPKAQNLKIHSTKAQNFLGT